MGLVNAPFDWGIKFLPRDSVAVDAIPDLGENQQIVYTSWMGRSPQDVEDQVSYPLTTALLGLPGVKSIRSNSMFGFSTIYIIFEEGVDFYWSRSRILEKINALPSNLLPSDVQPSLGPDATALGQIFWYTLEGRDSIGQPTGGWDLQELRSIQDYYVRYGLTAVSGVAEVSSIGGFVQEYQVDVIPDKMSVYGVTLDQVMKAIRESNLDIGAQTMEINLAEYYVRGLGYVKSIADLESAVVKLKDHVPIRIKDVAVVQMGPKTRRGILDKSGAEAVGGVVVARYGSNPMEVINNLKLKIEEISSGLPTKVLADGRKSQVSLVPYYDRSTLINETLGTLEEALSLEILITIIVVLLMLLNIKSSLLVASSLPVAVLMCFIAMKYFGVDANIVALSGIAIAVGTMVDMGIVLTESIHNHIEQSKPGKSLSKVVYEASTEVASAIITAVATTIISFLPVFTMVATEGKLFRPLAFTKTFALIASIVVTITILPPLAVQLFGLKTKSRWISYLLSILLIFGSILLYFYSYGSIAILGLIVGIIALVSNILNRYGNPIQVKVFHIVKNVFYALAVSWVLSDIWMPLGVDKSTLANFLFVVTIVGSLILTFYLVIYYYENILRFLLKIKYLFLVFVGFLIYLGVNIASQTSQEFMPALDEGSFLLMPSAMPHAGMEANREYLQILDMAVTAIPEVETVVGKAGRVESALDPAPMSMYENIILYKSEYITDEKGHRLKFKVDHEGSFILLDGSSLSHEKALELGIGKEDLVEDSNGRYFRQWRSHIVNPDDIWNEIITATQLPGLTSAPKLQPIETRLVMLQTGMRSPIGIKVKGSDLTEIEDFGIELEKHLKNVEGVKSASVFAERIVGKPYLLFDIDREKIARYGLSVQNIQKQIQATMGGEVLSTTVEGRERYGIRVRYPRELRNEPDQLLKILIGSPAGHTIPLGDLVDIRYEQGPQSIKSEDGFLLGYVLFDRQSNYSETDVVENAKKHLEEVIQSGGLVLPPGINYQFAGNYEQQLRANHRLKIVIPIALILVFLILYFQFRSAAISLMVFSGIFVAFSGGFIMIWLYGQPWFLDFNFMGSDLRNLFQVHTINLSVAVWVGFLALFGIATDDGVLVATFLKQSFQKHEPKTIAEIRDATVQGGLRRVKPAMMTTATTVLALLPVLSSTGRGADIMIPMAIPSFGGMTLQVITMFTVPILFATWKELQLRFSKIKESRVSSIGDNI
ncbi:efflux RND transporter permease subunit [Membranihabitans marinus]